MTTTALPPQLISSTVFRCWADGLAEPILTIYPGLRVDTANVTEWYELWIDQWSPRAQRQRAPELCDVRVTVHAFVKSTTDKSRVQQLMDQARTILTGRTIAMTDPDDSSSVLGYIKLGEADIKELTRMDADAQRHGLQHQTALWRGIGQRI